MIPRLVRFFAELVLCVVLLAFAACAYLNFVGVPSPLVPRLLRTIRSDTVFLEADAISMRGGRTFSFENAQVFRTCRVGPASFCADEIDISFDLFSLLRGAVRVDTVRIVGAVLRPDQLECPDATPGDGTIVPLQFRLLLDECEIRGVSVDQMECVLNGSPSVLHIEQIKGRVSLDGMSGDLQGDISYLPDSRTLRAKLVTRMPPAILLPFVCAYEMNFCERLIKRFEFSDEPPHVEFSFAYSSREPRSFVFNSSFRARDFSYRSVPGERGDGRVDIELSETNSIVSISDLFLVRPEGTARGRVDVDMDRQSVSFDIDTSFHPFATATIVAGDADLLERNFAFDGPVRMNAKGVVGYRDSTVEDAVIASFAGDRLRVGRFVVDRCSLDYAMKGNTNRVSNLIASLYGGGFRTDVEVILPTTDETNTQYRVIDGSIRKADFRPLLEAATGREHADHQGTISVTADIAGALGEHHLKSLNGTFSLSIKNGRVFMLPLFGGFSKWMARIIPGLHFVLRQSDASGDFTMGNGFIESEKISIQGDVLSLQGAGTLTLPQHLDFRVQVKLMKDHTLVAKVLRFATFPITKLLEFRVRGPFSDPNWYPINFSLDLLDKLGLRKEKKVRATPDDAARDRVEEESRALPLEEKNE